MRKGFFVFIILVFVGLLSAQSFGRNKIQNHKEEWLEINTIHFDVYVPKGSDSFGRLVSVMAEDTYYYLRNDFGIPLEGTIPLIVYPSQQDFMTTNVIRSLLSEGVGGFTESFKNRVVVPFNGSYKALEDVMTHELTHAYINALDKQGHYKGSYGHTNSRLPFWIVEGLPEFESLLGSRTYNEQFIIDMVLNDKLYPMDRVGGYWAYRQGEAFLNYIYREYSREKVMQFFYALRMNRDLDKVSQAVFGIKFKQLESEWKRSLKIKYYPYVREMAAPNSQGEQLTYHDEVGGSRNYGAVISPDGTKFLYFTDRDWRQSIWIGAFNEPEKHNMKVFTGESTGSCEGFNLNKNNLVWFPSGDLFAFATKTADGDRIHFMNLEGKIVHTLKFKNIDSIFELDISSDGNKIVFSGTENMQTDIYIYDLKSRKLEQITSDIYFNHQPVFSHDGKKIAFTSERNSKEDIRKGIFTGLTNQVYTYDISNKFFKQITFGESNSSKPEWLGKGSDRLFVLNDEQLSNIKLINLENHQTSYVTNIVSGVLDYNYSEVSHKLVLSDFYNGGWNLFVYDYPLDDLEYESIPQSKNVKFANDWNLYYNSERYQEIGRVKREFLETTIDLGDFQGFEYDFNKENNSNIAKRDSLSKIYNYLIDNVLDSLKCEPTMKDYGVKFKLDNIWGGAAYSSGSGTFGFLQASFSDLMGNHGLGVGLSLGGDLDKSSFIIQYLYLPYRVDFGLSLYSLYDEDLYQDANDWNHRFRKNNLDIGLSFLTNYPFNKFWRIELNNTVYQHYDNWDVTYDNEEHWGDANASDIEKYPIIGKDNSYLLYRPSFSVVHDNSLYGATGPLSGWRGRYTISANIGELSEQNITNYFDVRGYYFFHKRYALAGRILGGFSRGKGAYEFDLDNYYNGVRGYRMASNDYDRKNKLLASVEFRFPFIDYLDIGFPFPVLIRDVRGIFFMDAGTLWGKSEYDQSEYHWDAHKGQRLEDIKVSFGFGPRFNLGGIVFKFDFAWETDFVDCGKPTYMFSIFEDF